jgi:hypothetical protein
MAQIFPVLFFLIQSAIFSIHFFNQITLEDLN